MPIRLTVPLIFDVFSGVVEEVVGQTVLDRELPRLLFVRADRRRQRQHRTAMQNGFTFCLVASRLSSAPFAPSPAWV